MKVHSLDGGHNGMKVKPAGADASDKRTFQSVLENKMKAASPGGVPPSGVLQEPASIQEVFLSKLSTVEPEKIISMAERLLERLDTYRQKLRDPAISLDELSPFISKIAEENEAIASAVRDLKENGTLNEIVNQIMLVSSIELMRFTRGDYVAQQNTSQADQPN